MADRSAISWTDHSFCPWHGCTKVSNGEFGACVGCYAQQLDEHRFHRVKFGPGEKRVLAAESTWAKPLAWNRKAANDNTRPFVFANHLGDIFDKEVPTEWRKRFFDLVRATPNLVWLILTKRPGLIPSLYREACGDEPWPSNAAMGCTVVTQKEADHEVPALLIAATALNPLFVFVSLEPMMGEIDLTNISTMRFRGAEVLNALTGVLSGMFGDYCPTRLRAIDWVITGGETDQGTHKARATRYGLFRFVRDQCAKFKVAYHHKQNGEYAEEQDWEGGTMTVGTASYPLGPGTVVQFKVGKAKAGRLLDGRLHDDRPRFAA